jgi:Tfp pilus assembly protein PilX
MILLYCNKKFKGSAIPLVLTVIMVGTLMGTSFLFSTKAQRNITNKMRENFIINYVAEQGLYDALTKLKMSTYKDLWFIYIAMKFL